MLGLAVAATLVAIVLLVLEWGAYDFDTSPTGMRDAGRYDTAVQTAFAAAMPWAVSHPSTDGQLTVGLATVSQGSAITTLTVDA